MTYRVAKVKNGVNRSQKGSGICYRIICWHWTNTGSISLNEKFLVGDVILILKK